MICLILEISIRNQLKFQPAPQHWTEHIYEITEAKFHWPFICIFIQEYEPEYFTHSIWLAFIQHLSLEVK